MSDLTDDALKDADIDVAQFVDADGKPVEQDKLTARGLLMDAKQTFAPYERPAWQRATMNERFINGHQWGGWNFQRSEFVVDEWPAFLPRINRNILRNLHLTWQSRVTSKDPSVKAWGGESSNGDVVSADVSNKLISAWRQQNDHRRMISRAAWTCAAQSCVAFWAYWDTTKGPIGSDGMPLGDITVEPLAVFDWGSDGSEDIEQSDYCYVRRWLTKEVAREMLMKAGITTPPSASPAISIWGETRDLVECVYLYNKRTTRIPRGHYSIHVAGHVVESGDFPFRHNELPIIVWKCNDRPDSPHGGTHLDDAVPLQQALNRLHAALAKRTAFSAEWLKVIGPDAIIDSWDGEGQKIKENDQEKIAAVRIIEPGPVPAILWTQIEELERMISVVFGINEAVVGSDYSQSKNARMLAYISELDAQKFAPTIAARDHALMCLYRQMLSLAQQYIKVPRMLKIIGDAGLPEIVSFVGSDLATDVYLEPASGTDLSKTATAAAVEQDAANGLETVDNAKEIRKTGQAETSIQRLSRSIVAQQATQALQGFGVQADPNVDPAIAVDVILGVYEQNATAGSDRLAGLMSLLSSYRQIGAQQMAAMPQGGVTAPEQPKPGVVP
jgi:hypothetical protein